ncbi:LacI family DNA-binding transcriptional regulator [Rhodococcus erythropolis]|nr:LacI family DNA-binding transcriptional regulator [Rhodococcus erythropolis]
MARITSKDVAREAGVSQTTVSFVLNDRPDQTIPVHTRAAVLDAAHRLGYVPSAAARSLKRGRSNVVLCVLPDAPTSEAFEQFNRNLSGALGDADYTCVFLHARPETPLASLWQHVHPAVVAAFGSLTEADAEAIRRAGIALIDGVFAPNNSLIGLDQHDIGRMQIHHLAETGHTRMGFAAISDPREHSFCIPRMQGALDACRHMGLPEPDVQYVDYTDTGASKAVESWRDHEVTAVAAFNDLAALSVLAACRSANIVVPQDLAVIGVDNLPVSALATPALSTIAMDLAAPAHILAQKILAAAGALTPPSPPENEHPILSVRRRHTT